MLEIARVFFKAVKAETNYKDVDDVAFCNAVEHILAEREQKDKRIQELEEQVKTLDEAYTGVIKESKKWFDIAHNSIPKQAVIDKIEEYDKKMEEDAGHPNWVITDRIVMNVLQELLEGESK